MLLRAGPAASKSQSSLFSKTDFELHEQKSVQERGRSRDKLPCRPPFFRRFSLQQTPLTTDSRNRGHTVKDSQKATRRHPMHLYSRAVTPDINMGTDSSLTHACHLQHVRPIQSLYLSFSSWPIYEAPLHSWELLLEACLRGYTSQMLSDLGDTRNPTKHQYQDFSALLFLQRSKIGKMCPS